MGTGTTSQTNPLPAAPQPQDPFAQMLQARKSALRTIAAKRGMGSTMLTGPQQGSILGDIGYGGGK